MSATSPDLQALAAELLELSKTHQPSQNVFAPDTPLVAKAHQLIAAAQTPMNHVASIVSQVTEASVIRALLYLKAIQSIPTEGSVSLSDLAATTGAHASLLERLLRVVVGTGFITQTESGEYANTHLSVGYAGNAAVFLEMIYDEVLTPMFSFDRYLEAKRETAGLVEPDSATINPVSWYAGQEGKTAAEILARDSTRVARFQKIMGSVAQLKPYTGVYDFSKLATEDPERAVFVDVGGGHGGAITRMLEGHPQIKASQCVLQDRPEVVESARQTGALPEGVQYQAHDFFKPQPIKHARAYHLRAIAHDFSDANAVTILKHLTEAMAPDSKLLLAENVIPERGGSGMVGFMDIMIMSMGGKERTVAGFESVLKHSGLKVNGVHLAEASNFAVIEASLSV